jgi:hypothetical protein
MTHHSHIKMWMISSFRTRESALGSGEPAIPAIRGKFDVTNISTSPAAIAGNVPIRSCAPMKTTVQDRPAEGRSPRLCEDLLERLRLRINRQGVARAPLGPCCEVSMQPAQAMGSIPSVLIPQASKAAHFIPPRPVKSTTTVQGLTIRRRKRLQLAIRWHLDLLFWILRDSHAEPKPQTRWVRSLLTLSV